MLLATAFPTSELWLFPLAIGGMSILASVIGTFFARIGRDGSIMNALYKAVIVATVLSGHRLHPGDARVRRREVRLLGALPARADRPRP